MSYQRVKTVDFGPLATGLATIAYTLDGGSTWTTTGVAETLAGTGIYKATITFTDGFRGVLLWRTTDTDPKYAAEDINPETEEIPSQVWANTSRTITAFSYAVTVGGFTGGPTFRNQDLITTPTWEDCLASSWAAANAKEVESDSDKTLVRYMPSDHASPMRSFVLTTDANGNPVGRE